MKTMRIGFRFGILALVVVSGCAVNTFIEMCADGSGGTVIAWQDMRNGQQDIFAQRVGSSGTAAWGPSGIAVAAAGARLQRQVLGRPAAVDPAAVAGDLALVGTGRRATEPEDADPHRGWWWATAPSTGGSPSRRASRHRASRP